MKYKGFVIQPVYYCGSDFVVKEDGTIVDRTPTRKDIQFWEILDPDDNCHRWIAEDTVQECKDTIDAFLTKIGQERY